jgi:6,7-dimethyl-8-ribityllumazine synthase
MGLQVPKMGIVVGRFNDIVTSRLKEGALNALLRREILRDHIQVIEVPGSFELPLMAQWLIEHAGCDGVIALGAVIRGTTDHYDYVCNQTASGLMNVQLRFGKPVGFGVLTCDTLEQAFDRAGGKLGNKGAECAETVFEMISLKNKWLGAAGNVQKGSK